jgi:hypothetical protein
MVVLFLFIEVLIAIYIDCKEKNVKEKKQRKWLLAILYKNR